MKLEIDRIGMPATARVERAGSEQQRRRREGQPHSDSEPPQPPAAAGAPADPAVPESDTVSIGSVAAEPWLKPSYGPASSAAHVPNAAEAATASHKPQPAAEIPPPPPQIHTVA
jgi:hypothetical protein